MASADPTTRLTTREKEVLRAWLAHRTAKEIAIDLGISHHAVEKRLKMARMKLGAGSSREAARMLAEAEGYQPAVAGSPELPPLAEPRPSWRYRPIMTGGIVMSFAAVLALALLAANPTATSENPPTPTAQITLDDDLEPLFDMLDADKSGYLESPESPIITLAQLDTAGTPVFGNVGATAKVPPSEETARFYREADTDHDGRVSFREFSAWQKASLAKLGVERSTLLKVARQPQS